MILNGFGVKISSSPSMPICYVFVLFVVVNEGLEKHWWLWDKQHRTPGVFCGNSHVKVGLKAIVSLTLPSLLMTHSSQKIYQDKYEILRTVCELPCGCNSLV